MATGTQKLRTSRSLTGTRAVLFAAAVLAMISLLVVWLVIRIGLAKPVDTHVSVLQTSIEGSAYGPDVTAEQLLILADKQSQWMLDAFPNSASAYNLTANRDYLTGNLEGARANWSRALELDPRSSEAFFGLSLIAFEASDYERAIELGEQCRLINLGNPRVPLLLAESYLQNDQTDKAVLVLFQHIATEPTSVQALELLGNAFLNTREYDRAVTQFKRVLTFAPKSKDAHYGLAQAFAKLGDKEQAKLFKEKFDELSKDTGANHQQDARSFKDQAYAAHIAAQVFADSAMIYKQREDFKNAADCLLRAQKLQPDVVTWLAELQRSFYSLTKLREAADVGERLVQLDPKSVDNWLTLGQIYSDLQMPDAALAAFEQAVELAPEDDRCRRAQAVLTELRLK